MTIYRKLMFLLTLILTTCVICWMSYTYLRSKDKDFSGFSMGKNLDIRNHGPERALPIFDREGTASIKINQQAIHDKWIVITTVFPPTDDIKFLSKLKGWRVLVVGDTKTPSNWNYSNCIFLSVAEQEFLGLGLTVHLPYRSYARKNVGYLYAIAHGAKVIYETDDDNRPMDELKSFHLKPTMSGLVFAGSDLFNPYRHFGQSTLWPRGYPLAAVGNITKMSYRLKDNWKTPSIQQGVVNGDPDVDAIFRLTRKQTASPLQVTFDPAAPPVILPEGVFSPFNSQNTLFLYEALWAMFLPTTTTFRMCDIWRGYWAQRLLWEIGGHLAFFPPNAYQRRNAHRYMLDADDEKDMYFHTERLLTFLTNWTCPTDLSFFQCVFKLSFNMADEDFWQAKDVEMTRNWLSDLLKVGYREPPRIKVTANKSKKKLDEISALKKNTQKSTTHWNNNTRPEATENGLPSVLDIRWAEMIKSGTHVSFSAAEQIPPSVLDTNKTPAKKVSQYAEQIASLCPNITTVKTPVEALKFKGKTHFHNVLLIIIFNWPFYSNVRPLEVVYRPLFPNIIYCGLNSSKFVEETSHLNLDLSFIEAQTKGGRFGYICTIKAMQMGYNVTGFLIVGDDVLLNAWNLFKFNKSKLWTIKNAYTFNISIGTEWYWWNHQTGRLPYLNSMRDLRSLTDVPKGVQNVDKYFTRMLANTGCPPSCVHSISDLYYIPKRLKKSVLFYFTHFSKYGLMLELAIPATFFGLELKKDIQYLKGINLWLKERLTPWQNFSMDMHYLHPIKLTQENNINTLCSIYLPHLLYKGHL